MIDGKSLNIKTRCIIYIACCFVDIIINIALLILVTQFPRLYSSHVRDSDSRGADRAAVSCVKCVIRVIMEISQIQY